MKLLDGKIALNLDTTRWQLARSTVGYVARATVALRAIAEAPVELNGLITSITIPYDGPIVVEMVIPVEGGADLPAIHRGLCERVDGALKEIL